MLADAADEPIFERAAAEHRCLVSADADFGAILARREARAPSIILFRGEGMRRPQRQLMLLLTNLPLIARALEEGSLIVVERWRLRVRSLPFTEKEMS